MYMIEYLKSQSEPARQQSNPDELRSSHRENSATFFLVDAIELIHPAFHRDGPVALANTKKLSDLRKKTTSKEIPMESSNPLATVSTNNLVSMKYVTAIQYLSLIDPKPSDFTL
jgi:hypothetical protein